MGYEMVVQKLPSRGDHDFVYKMEKIEGSIL